MSMPSAWSAQVLMMNEVDAAIGESRLYEVTEPEAAWKDSLHIAWTASAEQRIKNYLGEPVNSPSIQEPAA